MLTTLLLNKNTYLVILIGSLLFSLNLIKDLNLEKERFQINYETALQRDSLEVAIYKITKASEIEDLLKQNNQLASLIDKSKIKTNRIQTLFHQQQQYVDSIKKKMDVSGLVSSIRKDLPATTIWKDSTECLNINGNVTYSNDSLTVNVINKEFKNDIVLIKSEGRRKAINWLFGLRLGKRKIVYKPQSKCGKNKVTIIEKVK